MCHHRGARGRAEQEQADHVEHGVSGLRAEVRSMFRRRTMGDDAKAGLTLGVESVPDGLAQGLLAGVNPVFGLYGYMVGTVAGALATSSAFMAVQATGAMSVLVADVGAVQGDDGTKALFTLSVLTGVVMLVAGALKLGSWLRFVSNAVTVGFINAVGVNIILGQLDDLTGFETDGANRVSRALAHGFQIADTDWPTLMVGLATIALIVLLERTPLGSLGLVVAVFIASALPALFDWDVAQLADIADIPRSLPGPELPSLRLVPQLLIPAGSLAFVGLIQGSAISASIANPDGTFPDSSRDFSGQGVANVASGLFQGMPVGGSMSATSLVRTAGARTRLALFVAGAVMALVILVFGAVVELIAMPSLAGLLIVVGFRTLSPEAAQSVWKTGAAQRTVMVVTFVLTLLIPLQYAVLVGIGISMILFVIGQSNRVEIRRWVIEDEGVREVEPPAEVPPEEVVVLQPYGSLFFASAPVFDEQMPAVTPASTGAVVIIRLRGREDLGSTFMDVLRAYAQQLHEVDSRLVLVSTGERVRDQLEATGLVDVIGEANVYDSGPFIGATIRTAIEEAEASINPDPPPDPHGDDDPDDPDADGPADPAEPNDP
jgi:SulP family sulfate permease